MNTETVNISSVQMCCLGVNHRTAPVAVRERFAVPKRCLEQQNAALAALTCVQECVLLSTCNRTELYFWSPQPQLARREILRFFLGSVATQEHAQLSACFYEFSGAEALRHLARVAAGLDSMVVGETEIFGQIKDAYRAAVQASSTATFANRTFQRIFSIGKKVRTDTRITSGPTSVGAAAVLLAERTLGALSGANVLIVGAGDIARSTAQSLHSRGAEGIFVANRSYDRAVELAERVGGRVIRFSEWVPYLEKIDIVIVSTASPVYVVSPAVLHGTQQTRAGRPLFLIDLSVPRNVDPLCSQVEGVHVYDIDTMQDMASASLCARKAEVERAESIITAWLAENARDLLFRDASEYVVQDGVSPDFSARC